MILLYQLFCTVILYTECHLVGQLSSAHALLLSCLFCFFRVQFENSWQYLSNRMGNKINDLELDKTNKMTCAPSEDISSWNVRVAERLALPTSVHGVAVSNPAGGEILPEPKRRFIAQSLSCSPFHRLKMTEILLKGRKTLTHPSISSWASAQYDQSLRWALNG